MVQNQREFKSQSLRYVIPHFGVLMIEVSLVHFHTHSEHAHFLSLL